MVTASDRRDVETVLVTVARGRGREVLDRGCVYGPNHGDVGIAGLSDRLGIGYIYDLSTSVLETIDLAFTNTTPLFHLHSAPLDLSPSLLPTMIARTLLLIALLGSASAATLTWDCTRIPNICSNDCYAIQCASKPTTLHRDSANASINRAETACKSPNRCANNASDSNSCDEYPYASSAEGGAGSVTRCVPSTENSRQGGTLSSFYTNNGITDGDAYNVAFANTGGLQYCSGSCVNTGNEVVKREASRVGVQYVPRQFHTDEGHLLTSKYDREERVGSSRLTCDATSSCDSV